MTILPVAGSAMLILSLALAWLLVAVRYLRVPGLTDLIVNDESLLKAHIDYLLMALLLYVFSLLEPVQPQWIQFAMAVGAFTNPLLFVLLAIRPTMSRAATAPAGIFATVSFLVTTVGFGGGAILVARAAMGG